MSSKSSFSHEEQRQLRKADQSALWHPFTQMQEYPYEDPEPPMVVKAEGNWLIASDGKRYLDANCGYWCLALGCRPQRVEQAIARQLQCFSHSTLLGITHEPAVRLAQRLTKLAGPPLSHAFFASSGSEAVEISLKMAYQYHVHNGHPERSKFLAFGEAYHGDTIGCVALGGIDLFHATFNPLLFPVIRVQPPFDFKSPGEEATEEYIDTHARKVEVALEENAGKLAALIIEPLILGPGGIFPHPIPYLQRIVDHARALQVPVIFDEVAVGMGRLGRLFAFEEIDRKPDIICLAKGLTAGLLPLSAVLATDKIYNAFLGDFGSGKTFYHGHTFTGSALGCAAALETLDIFTENQEAFLKEIRDRTIPHFWKTLQPLRDLPIVKDVRGRGLMCGIQLCKDKGEEFPYSDRIGHKVVLEARKREVHARAIGDVLLCVPPLTIKPQEMEFLGRVFRASLEAVQNQVL